jgi:hypothetical protein
MTSLFAFAQARSSPAPLYGIGRALDVVGLDRQDDTFKDATARAAKGAETANFSSIRSS